MTPPMSVPPFLPLAAHGGGGASLAQTIGFWTLWMLACCGLLCVIWGARKP